MGTPKLSSVLFLPHVWLPDFTGRTGPDPLVFSHGQSQSVSKKPDRPIDVLVVEDDRAIADMYRVQLEYDGYEVTVVPTGAAALESIASRRPDIVLLDLLLPDRSGLEVMVDLKEKLRLPPPVVILSNYGEPAMIERGLALGAVEYLVKSRVTPDTVSQSIPGWIERGRTGEPPRQQ